MPSACPSAIYFTPAGDIAMIVHIDDEDATKAEKKLASDPQGLVKTRMDRAVYNQCRSHLEIMTQAITLAKSTPDKAVQAIVPAIQAQINAINAVSTTPPVTNGDVSASQGNLT